MKSSYSDKRKLRVAVFGYGKMGQHHIDIIRKNTNCRLVGVADPAADLSPLFSKTNPDLVLTRNPSTLLQKAKPDVIHICTPPDTHADLSRIAVESNAHIYVEKPFALNTEDARKILNLAADHNRLVCAGHQLLMEYPGIKTQEALSLIGDIVHVESYFSFRQVRRNISPVEQLIDILPHPVYMLQHILKPHSSKPDSVDIQSVHVDPRGEIRSTMKYKNIMGTLIVSLHARPVESYLRIVGTNGSIFADFVLGRIECYPGPGASAPAILLHPFSKAKQIIGGSTQAIFRILFSSNKGYPGLPKLINAFYERILSNKPSPTPATAILDTVSICQAIEEELAQAETAVEQQDRNAYLYNESRLDQPPPDARTVAVTGGTGFLGRHIVTLLQESGWNVRVLCRRLPAYKYRINGVEYLLCDLSQPIAPSVLEGVSAVVHCAAETAGDQKAHRLNSIDATRHLLDAIRDGEIDQLVHMSSIAVLKPSRKGNDRLSETSPIDYDNIGRGPYVWGKAASEKLVLDAALKEGKRYKIIRLAPLVDYNAYQPPGRLGREIGPWFVAVGNRNDSLSLCSVSTAAKITRDYLQSYNDAPDILNLVEPNAPRRGELVKRHLQNRIDLKARWLPLPILKIVSPILVALQAILLRGHSPIDIYAAFSVEHYDTSLADQIIKRAERL